ncbi:MAG: ATP-binding cassette domain-containing protein [Lactobacillaceae bacterium]|jgi:ABC-type multidrug transport system ATPase subunit|nr:ATP-binding cassette domain-containing protein [Lactobacillaceae bacterium]
MKILEDISYKINDKKIFNNFTLNVADKGTTAIIGSNGKGKTTLLKIILRLLKINSGKVLSPNKMSYVPDGTEIFFGGITPQIYFDYLLDLENDEIAFKKRINKLQEQIEYPMEINDQKIANLSLGQRKMVMIVSALARETDLYILDEPFSGLDQKRQLLLSKTMSELSTNKPVLFTSHDNPKLWPKNTKIVEI